MGSIRNKLLLAYAVVTLPPLIGLGWYAGGQIESVLRTQGLLRLETRIGALSTKIEGFLAGTNGDALLMADTASLSQYLLALDSRDPALIGAAGRNLSQVFLRLSEIRRSYQQVRYIDAAGMEKIRVEREGDDTVIVPPARLQNERARDYFAQATKLSKGEVMVSALDLSRENGEIVEPYQPVIRFSTPVFDSASHLCGVLVINVAADPILDLVKNSPGQEETLLLVDSAGFYLSHPDGAKLWGGPGDLGNGANLSQDYPALASRILAATSIFKDEDRSVFTLAKPIPIPGVPNAQLGVLVDLMPTEILYSTASDFRTLLNVLTIVALLLVLALGSLVAHYVTRPITALTEAVEKMSRGQLDQPIEIISNDETQTLAIAMERLRKSMKVMLDKFS